MARYDKYIDMEFYENGEYLNYEGIEENVQGAYTCSKCGKTLKGRAYMFTVKDGRENTSDYESRAFGSECIKYVIGSGFGK